MSDVIAGLRRRAGWRFAAPVLAVLCAAVCAPPAGAADGKDAKTEDGGYVEDGRYYTADGTPTYHVDPDGAVDWYTYSGFRRYHSDCHVCHGPDGEGSTYAPALKDSVLTLSYDEFVSVVVNGRQRVDAADNSVMPSFGLNVNVMCYLDDIYTYLKARGDDAIPRGRPAKRAPKPDAAREYENACLGGN